MKHNVAKKHGTQQWHPAMTPSHGSHHGTANPQKSQSSNCAQEWHPAMALRQSRRVSSRDTALSQQHYNVSRNVLIKEVSQRSNKGSFSTF